MILVCILRDLTVPKSTVMKNFSKSMVLFALLFFIGKGAVAQQSPQDDQNIKKAEVTKLVNGGRYTFEATRVVLPKGMGDTLSRGYVLDISRDTMIAHLPHLAEQGVMITGADSSKSNYTFTRFGYRVSPAKNGGWLVTIVPRQVDVTALGAVRKVELNINSLGYTTLTLTTSKHSPVSYYGYIKPHIADFTPANAMH